MGNDCKYISKLITRWASKSVFWTGHKKNLNAVALYKISQEIKALTNYLLNEEFRNQTTKLIKNCKRTKMSIFRGIKKQKNETLMSVSWFVLFLAGWWWWWGGGWALKVCVSKVTYKPDSITLPLRGGMDQSSNYCQEKLLEGCLKHLPQSIHCKETTSKTRKSMWTFEFE